MTNDRNVPVRATRAERAVLAAQRAEDLQQEGQRRRVIDEVRHAALKADGSIALAGHIMAGVMALDGERRHLAKEDPALNLLLAEIEGEAVQQVKAIQRSIFDPWGLQS
jgi:hypothetical protein